MQNYYETYTLDEHISNKNQNCVSLTLRKCVPLWLCVESVVCSVSNRRNVTNVVYEPLAIIKWEQHRIIFAPEHNVINFPQQIICCWCFVLFLRKLYQGIAQQWLMHKMFCACRNFRLDCIRQQMCSGNCVPKDDHAKIRYIWTWCLNL